MKIDSDTTFVQGIYNFPDGVRIVASQVTLDLNGAVLVGNSSCTRQVSGITLENCDHVTIKNGVLRNYYYGIQATNTKYLTVQNNVLSFNWIDPNSRGPRPPWLNIFVTPSHFSDCENFGGGLFVNGGEYLEISKNTLSFQENGMDLFYVNHSTIQQNVANNNTGWGIHLYKSSSNKILNNTCQYCNRANLGDSAGILASCSSSNNTFIGNQVQWSGDGFYLAWTPEQSVPYCCTNDYNILIENDASYAGANAFESDFNRGNQFYRNIANNSNFGFWLGYSVQNNIVRENIIAHNRWVGIAIDHGQNFVIENNELFANGKEGKLALELGTADSEIRKLSEFFSRRKLAYSDGSKYQDPPWIPQGVLLWTDLEDHYPPQQFACLSGYDHRPSTQYRISGNTFYQNEDPVISFINTTNSIIYNNGFYDPPGSGLVVGTYDGLQWNLKFPAAGPNIIGGKDIGGNYFRDYHGCDHSGDGIGDTEVPYTNKGQIKPGDYFPLTNGRCGNIDSE